MSLNHSDAKEEAETEAGTELLSLVDCNSFYVSCERVFNPKLRGKPVIVLSNNDGCIISLSAEAKAVGIKMGAPFFEMKDLVKRHQVSVFSSNYTLYGDMSARVMQTLSEFSPEVEIYSIDEAFLGLKGIPADKVTEYGHRIRDTVYRNTGIPVSVGIASTKVLAKLANRVASQKKWGVFSIHEHPDAEEVLRNYQVGGVWGVGRKSNEKLSRYGIKSARDLRDADPKLVRELLTITGARIQAELRGEPCIELDDVGKEKKQIISTRSFGQLLSDIVPIREAVANHVTRAAEKLRDQGSVCFGMHVFIHTNGHREGDEQHYGTKSLLLPEGISETNRLISYAQSLLQSIYRKGHRYKKCGVTLFELHPKNENQMGLFETGKSEKAQKM